jgi:hypothetical protein
MNKISRLAVGAVPFLYAASAFAQADTDGFMPALNYTTLGANVSSMFGQASPIILVVVGISLALGLVGWAISTLKGVFGRRA